MVISLVNAGLSFVECKGDEPAGEAMLRLFAMDDLSLPNPVKKA
jgi:hypothetical protein